MILSVILLTKGLKEIIIIINIKRWVMKLLLKATFVSNECLFLWCMLIILSHSNLGRSIEYESRWMSRLQLENEWVVCRVRRRWLKWMLLKKSLYKFLGRKRLFLLLFFSLSLNFFLSPGRTQMCRVNLSFLYRDWSDEWKCLTRTAFSMSSRIDSNVFPSEV